MLAWDGNARWVYSMSGMIDRNVAGDALICGVPSTEKSRLGNIYNSWACRLRVYSPSVEHTRCDYLV